MPQTPTNNSINNNNNNSNKYKQSPHNSPSAHHDHFNSPLTPSSPPFEQSTALSPSSKGKSVAKRQDSYGATPIHQLPTETLSHIFAHLSPAALGHAQLVCKHWARTIDDESSWRTAFETYYGLIDQTGKVALGRRLEPSSWRSEYIGRVALLQRWTKSRTPSITHDPQLGPITAIHFNFPRLPSSTHHSRPSTPSTPPNSNIATPDLLSISLPFNRAVLSSPFTGKVSRTQLSASPIDNFGQPVHPHLPLLSTESFAISPDGSRVVWGMNDGSFRLVDCSSNSSLAGRAWAGVRDDAGDRVRSLEGHRRTISALKFTASGEYWVSVGLDGGIGLWTSKDAPLGAGQQALPPRLRPAGRCIWKGQLPEQVILHGRAEDGPPRPCEVAVLDAKAAKAFDIAVGMTDGTVFVWTGVKVDRNLSVPSDVPPARTPPSTRLPFPSSTEVSRLIFVASTGISSHLFIHHSTSSSFHRYDYGSLIPNVTTFSHLKDNIGEITAFAFDFAEPPVILVQGNSAPSRPAITSFESYANKDQPGDGPSPTPPSLPNSLSQASIDTLASTSSTLSLDVDEPEFSNPTIGSQAFGRKKYVVAGDAQGRVFVWDWESVETTAIVEPRSMVQGFASKVTALEVTDVGVFVGMLDGTLKVYDTLTGIVLRTFKDRAASRLPARMLAQGLIDDEDRWKVSAILANRESVIAAIGGRVLAWRIEVEVKKRKGKGAGGRMSARGERVRSEYDLRQEVRESLESAHQATADRLDRIANERRVQQEFGLPPSLDNMTEDEAVAFAMMLSVDDEEARWFEEATNSVRNSPSFGAVSEELLDMEGLSLDDVSARSVGRAFGNRRGSEQGVDEEGEDEDHASTVGSYSNSLSVPTSPYLRGGSLGPLQGSSSPSRSFSHSWRPSSTPSPTRSSFGTSTKVQLSPRLGPTYGEASSAASVPVPDLDMSEELWPSASSSPPVPPRSPTWASPRSPVATSPPQTSHSPSAPTSAVTPRKSWNEIARSASNSPSPSPLAASSLTARLRKEDENRKRQEEQERDRRTREREEEELRFAIELSLAEEKSRIEQ
ncbi:hypothetical protein T439DRAFT_354766 [Meredithblackwellia eburnea MCA 4105]